MIRRALAVALIAAGAPLLADTKSAAPKTDPEPTNTITLPKPGTRRSVAPAPSVTPSAKPVVSAPKSAPAPVRAPAAAPAGDVLLKAMRDEIDRARALSLAGLEVPYYVEYTIDDAHQFSVSATLGSLLQTSQNRYRVPTIKVRVGDYKFDNTNYIFSDFFSGSRYDSSPPLDDDYAAIRRMLWLGTDRAYKTAVEAIGRKRAAIRNVTVSEELPDFWKAEPVQKVTAGGIQQVDGARWTQRVKALSKVFLGYPEVLASSVSFDAIQSVHYQINTEGSTVRLPDGVFYVQVRATGQADDGMPVRSAAVLPAIDTNKVPAEADIRKAVTEVADNVKALRSAPVGETYSGPVIFEGVAAAQLFAEVLGGNLNLPRKPVGEPGRPVPFVASELEGRIGSKILPDFMEVVDDPTKSDWNGTPLVGALQIDDEGVTPKPLTLIEAGKLKGFLLTRQPVKGFEGSNGRARLPGGSGARTATYTNLFVRASESVKAEELKSKLIEMIKARNKPYGVIVRKLDYPSSASFDELRRISANAAQTGGGARPTSVPLMVYRVYPDGKEELVRGLRFRGLNVRSLKDIVAVSNQPVVFSFLNNLAPFALMGAGGYMAPVSVVAPSVLFEDLELEKPQEDLPKPPLVPAPELTASAR
jgi:hypothetical protein